MLLLSFGGDGRAGGISCSWHSPCTLIASKQRTVCRTSASHSESTAATEGLGRPPSSGASERRDLPDPSCVS